MHETLNMLLGNQGDMNSNKEYMNLLINYSIYRKIFQIEDSSLYKKIWALQKKCPIIILYNDIYLNAGRFLTQVCPLKKKTSVDPKDIGLFMDTEVQNKAASFAQET